MANRLKEIIVSVTHRCNLRCAMCQIPDTAGNKELSSHELRGLINDASLLCPESIVFSGGEPLLREDIFDLVSLVSHHKINTCLTSNGTLLDKDVARKLALAGMGVVNISIEGNEDVHDSLRGKGNFHKAVEALKHLREYKIESTIATTISALNYASLPYVMDLAHKYGVTTVKFQPFSEIFLLDKHRKDNFLFPDNLLEDVNKNIKETVRLAREYGIHTNPEGYLCNIPAYLSRQAKKERVFDHCPALWSSCPISAEGNVYPCWVLSKYIIGNVRSKKLSDIWDSYRHNRIRQRIIKHGCQGCMMSCYDHNFGKPSVKQPVLAKVKKLKKRAFYEKKYFQAYQNTKYLAGKLLRKARLIILKRRNLKPGLRPGLSEEIRSAKATLRAKIRSMRK